jgi:hypothetical protein
LREWGYACDVIAPSLTPTRPGVQRKHDKRDAVDLARWLEHLTSEASPLAPADQLVFREYHALLAYKLPRRDELDRQIEQLALTPALAGGRRPLAVFPWDLVARGDGAGDGDRRLAPV